MRQTPRLLLALQQKGKPDVAYMSNHWQTGLFAPVPRMTLSVQCALRTLQVHVAPASAPAQLQKMGNALICRSRWS